MLATSSRKWLLAALIVLATTAIAGAATKISYVSPQISPASPGSTNSVTTQIQNTSKQAKTVRIITSVPGYGGVKCQTPVWLPAESRFRWAFPIMIPPVRVQKFRSIPIAAAVGGQRVTKSGNQFLQMQLMRTAALEGKRSSGVTNVALAMRRQMGLPKVMTYLTIRNFPLTVSSLLSIQCMYAGSIKSQLTGPQIQTLRDWVIGGGRLWIDLGHATGRQLARKILGRKYDLAYVQTIRSAKYSYDVHGRNRVVRLPHSQPMRCYFPGNSEVIVKTHHWPVVVRYRMGRGQVWLSTMHWRGLIAVNGKAMSELWPATRSFFAPNPVSIVSASALSMAANSIGYRVASRQSIVLILGVLILVVAIGGWALGRRGMGGLLGALAIGAAFIASGALFAFGQLERGPVPQSESAIQIAALAANRSFVEGQAALFAPQQITESAHVAGATITRWNKFLNGQRNCHFDYSSNQNAITVRHLTIPSGKVVDVVYKSFQDNAAASVVATVGVNQSGFVGSIASKYDLKHPIIAGPSGILGLKIGGRKKGQFTFTAGSGQVLPAGQYMSGVLLTRKNQREESLTAAELQAHPVDSPELLAWSRDVPPAWRIAKAKLHLCSTLVVLPLRPHLPPTGQAVDIPWPMMRLQIVRGPRGQMSAPVYNFDRHKWIAHMTISGRVYMKFSVPRALRDMRATLVHVAFAVAAPGRTVSLAIRHGSTWTPVARLAGGQGVIDKSLRLAPGEYHHGRIMLRLHVGFPKQPSSSWHFVYGRVSISGKAE